MTSTHTAAVHPDDALDAPATTDVTPSKQTTDATTAANPSEPEPSSAADTASSKVRRVVRPRTKRPTPSANAVAADVPVKPARTGSRTPRKIRSAPTKTAPDPATDVPSNEDTTDATELPVLQLALNTQSSVYSDQAVKPVKRKKNKLVRDSFTLPKTEFAVLGELKRRAAGLVRPVKKSELIRAGIQLLADLPDTAFVSALNQISTPQTDRP